MAGGLAVPLLGATGIGASDAAAGAVQPFLAGLRRSIDALARCGEPLAPATLSRLVALHDRHDAAAVLEAERLVAPHVLMSIDLDADGFGITRAGAAPPLLVERGWRTFLIRVANPAGLLRPLWFDGSIGLRETGLSNRNTLAPVPSVDQGFDLKDHWLVYSLDAPAPMQQALSGLPVEYRLIQLQSLDRGRRRTYFMGHAEDPRRWMSNIAGVRAQSTTWSGRRTGYYADFECAPTEDVVLAVKDWDGRGCMAQITVRDDTGRVYPALTQRFAPDFDFQPQVYRADGETLRLPAGRYLVESTRGPEYLVSTQAIELGAGRRTIAVKLDRWINAPALGWYSGDTHIHAAGCSHYEQPTAGVSPETMIRHVRGEALSVGEVLTWGPGYYYQKKFFSGAPYRPTNTLEHPELQPRYRATLQPRGSAHDDESLIRYDIEVSGFPSSHSGHLVLLRLSEQDYPGAQYLDQWPSYTLPIAQWARSQGALVGYAHCGPGMDVDAQTLPNWDIPRFDNVGANAVIVDVTHDAVDFVSCGELTPLIELNFWYHLRNCGFNLTMVGETDFPCLSDQHVGAGRTYVGLDASAEGAEGYERWIGGLRAGRAYFGDGRSHFIDFRVDGVALGRAEAALTEPGKVRVDARIAARLAETAPDREQLPAWHIEHARIPGTRDVMVEVVVNGHVAASSPLRADGKLHSLGWDLDIADSAWIALRILPSGHTNPIVVKVAGRPVRASRRSARWCLDCVDRLWSAKERFIRAGERDAALASYDRAREAYRARLAECVAD